MQAKHFRISGDEVKAYHMRLSCRDRCPRIAAGRKPSMFRRHGRSRMSVPVIHPELTPKAVFDR